MNQRRDSEKMKKRMVEMLNSRSVRTKFDFSIGRIVDKFITNRRRRRICNFFISSLSACSLWLWHYLGAVCMLNYM